MFNDISLIKFTLECIAFELFAIIVLLGFGLDIIVTAIKDK